MSSIVITALLVLAAAAAPPPTSLDSAVRRYDMAQVNSDKAELEALLAEDYVLVNSGGEVEDKRQFIADQLAPGYKLERFTVLHPIERRWRDGAVLGGLALLRGLSDGKPFNVCLRFADVWRLRGGRWQVVYTQAARAKPEDCSAGKR
jgi:ketosteroid isomerase-like protein